MIQGLYTAAAGMVAVEARQSAIANNIANASTPGFKRQEPVQLGFYEVFSQNLRRPFLFTTDPAPAGGVKIVETFTNTAAGALRNTENPLHVALQGPGYFAIDTPNGERYTRDGAFTIDADGHLATKDGSKVQSISGQPIDVSGGTVNIARNGSVTVEGSAAGQIRVIEFEEPTRLLRQGDNLYAASEEVLRRSANAADTTLEQKNLEMSNVNLPQEMTAMMLGLRAYEANSRVIQALDSTIGRLIDQVAMPQV